MNYKQKNDLIVCRKKSQAAAGEGSETEGLGLDAARGWVGGNIIGGSAS